MKRPTSALVKVLILPQNFNGIGSKVTAIDEQILIFSKIAKNWENDVSNSASNFQNVDWSIWLPGKPVTCRF